MEPFYVHSIDKLPESIRISLENANVFYSEGYEQYALKCGKMPIYLYTQDYILLLLLNKKYLFRYADLPVEYFTLSNSAKTTPREFLDACVRALKRNFHVQWINPTHAAANFDECPSKCLKIPFGSNIADLTQPEAYLWSMVHSKHKNSIRRAEKCGVEIKCGGREFLDDYLKLETQTWNRVSEHVDNRKRYLELFETLNDHMILFMAYKNEVPQGGAVFFYNKAMSYYMFGASADHPESGAMNLLHWNAMLYMRSIGTAYYSFVGHRINEDKDSKCHTIQRFKARFGAELKVGFMFKVILNPLLYHTFRFFIRLKSHHYNGDAIDHEIHKWTQLNN